MRRDGRGVNQKGIHGGMLGTPGDGCSPGWYGTPVCFESTKSPLPEVEQLFKIALCALLTDGANGPKPVDTSHAL